MATITSLLASVFNVAIPRLLGRSVDAAHALTTGNSVESEETVQFLAALAGLLLAAATLRGLFQMISGYLSEFIAHAYGRDLRIAYFDKLQRMGFDFHDRIHSGDLITRGMLDLEGVRGFVENAMQRFIALVLLASIGALLLFSRDTPMALVTLSFVPLLGWRAGRMGLTLRGAWTRLQERLAILTRVMEENLEGVRVVRAFSSQRFEIAKFDTAGNDALAVANERIVTRAIGMSTINAGYYFAMVAVLWFGSQRVAAGYISIGELTEFLTFMTILQMPVRQVGMIMNSSARAISSGKRLYEILDMELPFEARKGTHDLIVTVGQLRFENVSFSYDVAAPNSLEGISFEVKRGQTLGIVGPSGGGKSTIAHLIPRFYDVSGGRITIDGHDIRDVTLESLRRAVSVVQQDVFLFDDSVASNVAYPDPDAGADDLVRAAATAQIHDYVTELAGGYRTRIGERGVGLSGGQRQRLSIARGIIEEPSIVIYDDASSAVDAATEHHLRRTLREAGHSTTTIIISHRLASLMHADEIIVLDRGHIVERGRHEELSRAGGLYSTLFLAQWGAREEVATNSDEWIHA
ncbi:ABC transporter ATP-binding protein [Methylosinus sp. H3A]|uniref:ABC transporter ATP-binding protein n=1 Tax=Methylosinus sp. H3A TaxID=2785786 RepID=UPI001FEDE510|nr:ABC transporter ATP-binding protein [Methylosinus sp. H3A]